MLYDKLKDLIYDIHVWRSNLVIIHYHLNIRVTYKEYKHKGLELVDIQLHYIMFLADIFQYYSTLHHYYTINE